MSRHEAVSRVTSQMNGISLTNERHPFHERDCKRDSFWNLSYELYLSHEWYLSRMNGIPLINCLNLSHTRYGVDSISRLLKIIGLFSRILSLLSGSFAKETCNFKEPTERSHPIFLSWMNGIWIESCRTFTALVSAAIHSWSCVWPYISGLSVGVGEDVHWEWGMELGVVMEWLWMLCVNVRCMYRYTHTHTHTCIHTHIHAYTHTHTHTYTKCTYV